jgi:hypothetical protein
MEPTAVAALTDHFHRFVQAVKEACGLPASRGLLAAPMALIMWICTRRIRKEAAAAMADSLQALTHQLAVLLEQFREGKLPPVYATASAVEGRARGRCTSALGRRPRSPLRCAEDEGPAPGPAVEERVEPARDHPSPSRPPASSGLRSGPVHAPPRPAPPSRQQVTPRILAPPEEPQPQQAPVEMPAPKLFGFLVPTSPASVPPVVLRTAAPKAPVYTPKDL